MTFVEAITSGFKKYVDFTGRASRSEFWWWVLFIIVGAVITGFVGETLSGLFSLVIFLPNIAVAARRLHDTNRSGWWQLLAFIPLIGIIILIVWYIQEGREPNDYN